MWMWVYQRIASNNLMMRCAYRGCPLTGLVLGAAIVGRVDAQTPSRSVDAGEAITAAAVSRHLDVLAVDSMRNRDTPSDGLEAAARYVAGEFQALGLTPGSAETWIQRYPIPEMVRVDPMRTRVSLIAGLTTRGKPVVHEDGEQVRWAVGSSLATDARPAVELVEVTWQLWAAPPATLVSGRHTPASLRQSNLRNMNVFYLPPANLDSAIERRMIDSLHAMNPVVVVLSRDDSATFAARRRAAASRPLRLVDEYMRGVGGARGWAVYLRAEPLRRFFAVAGADLAQAEADTAPRTRPLAIARANLRVAVESEEDTTATAPNVVGILEGSDPVLRNEYVVFSAHIDTDSVARNGDVDNASGIAGLLELAKAFSQPGARPRRSLVFLAASGGKKQLWGSQYFLTQQRASAITANINLDMLGHAAGDTLTVDGLDDVDIGASLLWTAAAHPELRFVVRNGGGLPDRHSDHFAFVRQSIPSLHFSNGVHEDTADGASMTVDPEHEARILRLIYLFSRDGANGEKRPMWTTAGRQRARALRPER